MRGFLQILKREKLRTKKIFDMQDQPKYSNHGFERVHVRDREREREREFFFITKDYLRKLYSKYSTNYKEAIDVVISQSYVDREREKNLNHKKLSKTIKFKKN